MIGWEFDLRYDHWTVCLKPRAIDKIYAALHMVQRPAAVKYVLRRYLKIYSLMHPAGELNEVGCYYRVVKLPTEYLDG